MRVAVCEATEQWAFSRSWRRGVSKLGKSAIKLATASGIVPGSTILGSVVQSKLESMGEAKKRKMLLQAAEQDLATSKSSQALASKLASITKAKAAPKAATKLSAGRFTKAKKVPTLAQSKAKKALSNKQKVGKLPQDQQVTLYEAWTEAGKPGDFYAWAVEATS